MITKKARQFIEERIFGRSVLEEDPQEVVRRNLMAADFQLVFMRNPRGRVVLSEIARILHFTDPALTDEDRVLQNAFKTILHRMGRWSDDRKGADDIIERLLKE